MPNKSAAILYKYRNFLTPSERRFLASVSPHYSLSWRQNEVVQTIRKRARIRYMYGV